MSSFADLVVAEWWKVRTTRLLVGTVPAAVAISAASVAGIVAAFVGLAGLRATTTRDV